MFKSPFKNSAVAERLPFKTRHNFPIRPQTVSFFMKTTEAASEHLLQSLRLLEGKKEKSMNHKFFFNACVDKLRQFMSATGLETASTRSERISVLKVACFCFDHQVKAVHDLEIQVGTADRLCAHLKRAINDQHNSQGAERICKLLTMVYQCTDEVAAASFCRVGFELVPCIFKLASKHALSGKQASYAEQLIVRFSLVDVSLGAVKNNEEILAFLLRQILCADEGIDDVMRYALALLAGMTSHQDSKRLVMKFPGLFDAVVDVAMSSKGVETRYESARLLSKLAWDIRNRGMMGQTQKCVKALVLLSESGHQHVRVEAYTVLHHLSADADNKARLVSSADGKLVESLMDAVNSKLDDQVRVQALEILLTLISRETYMCISSQPGLIDRLADLSSSRKQSNQIAALAAQTIKRFATYVQVKQKCHDDLIRAMVRMAGCNRKAVLQWTAKAFLDQCALFMSKFYLARDPDALDALAQLTTCCYSDVKASALEAVVNLTDDVSNAKKLATSTRLLEALVSTIENHTDSDDAILRRHAVQAILSLATHRASTKRMAKQFGLVSSLSRYGVSQDNDVELKRSALHGVLLLAPFF
jgi:hypothetical protein